MVLTELGRVFVYNFEIAEYKGFIEVRKGSMQIKIDPFAGIYLATLSPNTTPNFNSSISLSDFKKLI